MAIDDLTRRHLLAGLGALGLAGCKKSGGAAAPAARRIVTVGGAITETVYALGLGGEVVAADTSSIFPEEAKKLPQVGYQRALSAEGVVALKPTLVLASHDAGPPAVIEQIKASGVEVTIVPGPPTIEGAQAKMRAIGQRLGKVSEAEALAARIATQAAPGLAQAKAAATRPRVLAVFARGPGAIMVSGTGSAAASMVELAGGQSASEGIAGTKPMTSEAAVSSRADVLLATTQGIESVGGLDGLVRTAGLSETPAAKNRRVIVLDDLLLLGFGPRTGDAVTQLARLLHGAG